jgi:hypothetical protein
VRVFGKAFLRKCQAKHAISQLISLAAPSRDFPEQDVPRSQGLDMFGPKR